MAPIVHKPVHVKTKQQNVIKLQQLFLQQKFISLVSLINKQILSMIIMKKLDLFIQKCKIYTKISQCYTQLYKCLMDTQYTEL